MPDFKGSPIDYDRFRSVTTDDVILVLAGAGTSKAVDPVRYPTTVEFFERIPDSIKHQPLFQHAVAYLTAHATKAESIDIEQVLWLIRDLREWTHKAANPQAIPGWFLNENRLSQISEDGWNVRPIVETSARVTSVIDALSSSINALVYDLYADPPPGEQLEHNWLRLLKGIMGAGRQLEIVTTNYDIVIEEALSIARAPVLTGRTTGNQPMLDLSLWDLRGLNVESFQNFGRLTKLHGSVDWVRGRNSERIHVGTPLFQGRHDRHAIIYPGFKGPPSDPVFQLLHRYVQERLAHAETVVFIGYAFRDEYINSILERDLRRGARVIVLNPAERLSGIPFAESRMTYIPKYFDTEGVDAVLTLIGRAPGQVVSP